MENNISGNGNSEKCTSARFSALIPFFVFMAFYLGLSVWAQDFYKVPMPAAFLVASATALLMNRKSDLAQKVEIYAQGMGEVNIMIMCLIFILAGAFATAAKGMGAVDAAVLIARHLIPPQWMLCGIFFVSCFISLAIGTSCGTIAALTPIALELAGQLGFAPAMFLGATVGGAMFGDNMSMISDTTIAATRTQNVAMRDKFITNLKLVIPPVIICAILYVILGRGNSAALAQGVSPALPAIGWKTVFAVLPYVLILVCALLGLNVMMLLFLGTVLAAVIGILAGSFDFWGSLDLIGKGTLGMSETLIVAILAGGLLKVIRHNGGIDYLIGKIEKHVKTERGCEFGILLLVSVVNCFTANNTVAIVISGPIAHDLSEKFKCNSKRIASILDAGSCVIQGIIPYGAQILIAVGIAQSAKVGLSSLGLLQSLYYPFLLGITLILSIVLNRKKA